MRLFVTATGTGTGKTFVTAALAGQANSARSQPLALKPVMSGFDPAKMEESDAGILLRSLGKPATEENIAEISPWRFKAALGPSMAAPLEERSLDFEALVAHSRK